MIVFSKQLSAAAGKFLVVAGILLIAACGSPEDRARSHYERGMKLLEEKDYTRASLEIRNAIKLKEDMAPAWVALSKIEEYNQNWEAVGRILRRAISLDAKDADSKLRLSRLLLLGNQLDEPLKLVDAALELDSKNTSARSLRAAILFKRGDHEGAVREASAALAIDATNAEALIVLAASRLRRGDAEGALAILERGGAAHDKNVAVQLLKVRIFESQTNLRKIEAVLHTLIEHYPDEPIFRKQLVQFLVQNKRQDDAEKQLRAISAANASNVEAGLDVVRFLLATKGADAARQDLMARIKSSGNVLPYQLALADLYFQQGSYNDATHLLESVAKTASQDSANQASVRLAEMQHSRKKTADAEALIGKVLAQDRRNIGALKLRAIIQLDRGQYDAAIADLREALNDKPRDPDILTVLAVAFERSGQIELADERFAAATRASNFSPNVGLQYVAFLQRRGNRARAEDVLLQLAGRSPNSQEVLSALAQSKMARGDWVGAQEIADGILRIGSNPGLANQIRGAALAGQQKLTESIDVLEGDYEARPQAIQPMVALVRAYVRSQKFDEAEAVLKKAIASEPASAEAQILLGSVKLARNQPEEALKSYSAAIKQQPANAGGYRALAALYMGQGKRDEAMKVIREGLQQQPDQASLRLVLAQLFELNGDFEAAISVYEQLAQQQPGSVVFANNLASLLLDHRTDAASLEKAGSLAARLRKSPVPQFKDTLGWLHYRRGEFKQAISLLEEAANELPNLPVVQYHLGLSYIASGQPDKGAERLKKALELLPNGGISEEAVRSALKKAGVT